MEVFLDWLILFLSILVSKLQKYKRKLYEKRNKPTRLIDTDKLNTADVESVGYSASPCNCAYCISALPTIPEDAVLRLPPPAYEMF